MDHSVVEDQPSRQAAQPSQGSRPGEAGRADGKWMLMYTPAQEGPSRGVMLLEWLQARVVVVVLVVVVVVLTEHQPVAINNRFPVSPAHPGASVAAPSAANTRQRLMGCLASAL